MVLRISRSSSFMVSSPGGVLSVVVGLAPWWLPAKLPLRAIGPLLFEEEPGRAGGLLVGGLDRGFVVLWPEAAIESARGAD